MKRSNFVTFVAMIVILFSGFMAFATSIPMMTIIPLLPELYGTTENLPPKQFIDMPITRAFATVCVVFFIASLANIVLSLGLLIRAPWARIPFAVAMVMLMMFLVARVLLFQIRYVDMTDKYTSPFDFTRPGFIFTICIGIFCIWFIKHLLSRRVAAEFRIQQAVNQQCIGQSLRNLGEERNDIRRLEKAERAYYRSLDALAAPDAAYYRETVPDAACYQEQVLSELKAVQELIRDWKAGGSTSKAN